MLVLLNPFRNVVLDDRVNFNLSSQPHSLSVAVSYAINVLRAFGKASVAHGQKICRMATTGHIAKLSSGPEESFQQIDISD